MGDMKRIDSIARYWTDRGRTPFYIGETTLQKRHRKHTDRINDQEYERMIELKYSKDPTSYWTI